jgi:hypothetical protein
MTWRQRAGGLFFLVLLSRILVLPLVLLVLSAVTWVLFKQPSWPAAAWLAGCLSLSAGIFLSARRCASRRRFILLFSRWFPLAEREDEAGLLARGARESFERKDFPKSQRLLDRALSLSPSQPLLHQNLANVLALSGRLEELRAHLAIHEPNGPRAKFMSKRRTRRLDLPLWTALSAAFLGLCLASSLGFGLWLAPQVGLDDLRPDRLFSAEDFRTYEDEQFLAYYHDPAFLSFTLATAREALRSDLEHYGLSRDQFGGSKIRLYLCDTQKEYLARAPFTRSWEGGCSLPEQRCIYLWHPGNAAELKNILAHELSHLCTYQFFSGIKDRDDWLNEGLACYLGYTFGLKGLPVTVPVWLRENVFADLKERHLPFQAFLSATPHEYGDDTDKIGLFYTQGFSVVFMLIEYFGEENFYKFLRTYARTNDISSALAETYPKISNIQDLQGMWLLFMTT